MARSSPVTREYFLKELSTKLEISEKSLENLGDDETFNSIDMDSLNILDAGFYLRKVYKVSFKNLGDVPLSQILTRINARTKS